MSHIEWHSGLSLGIEKIDDQHKNLIDLSNKLMDAAKHGASKNITEAFHSLREYTVYHFNDEEEYMRRIKYPKLHEHSQQHLILKQQVKYYQEALYKKAEITESEILGFLKKWLIDHIVYNDLDIKRFLESKPDN
jgi:hemerythrin-like metal-binding protein